MLLFELERVGDELFAGANLARSIARIRITKKQIRSKWHAVAHLPADDVVNRHAPLLPEDVETGKLERGQNLRAIVVERRRRIRDQKAHLLELRRIAADEYDLSP